MNVTRLFFLLTLLAAPAFAQNKPKEHLVFTPGETAPLGADAVIQTNGDADAGAKSLDGAVTAQIADFFAALKKKEVDAAYDKLTKGSKIVDRPDDLVTLKSKTEQAIQIFGDISGAECVGASYVGTHLLCATYVSLGKDLPLRWKFYFYKSGVAWKLIDIRVDDRLVDMFGEPAATDQKPPSNWPKQ